MNHQQLSARLYLLAVKGFKSARRNNPFWSTREASAAVVGAFNLIENYR